MENPLIMQDIFRKNTPNAKRSNIETLFSKKSKTPMRQNKFSSYLKNTRKKVLNKETTQQTAIKVLLKIKPSVTDQETAKNYQPNLLKISKNSLKVKHPKLSQILTPKKMKIYKFDKIFNTKTTNSELFKASDMSLSKQLFQKQSSLVFAYGMANTGKTFTMFGNDCEQGIVSMQLREVFWQEKVAQKNKERNIRLKVSFLEIHDDKPFDLLSHTSPSKITMIEDSSKGVLLPNLTELTITSFQEGITAIRAGQERRLTASTEANESSSSSHAVVFIICEHLSRGGRVVKRSQIAMIDLAGAERTTLRKMPGEIMKARCCINKNLLALGKCINLLSLNNKHGTFIPYRDSKITLLFKHALKNSTSNYMLACIDSCADQYNETLYTLEYAMQARQIKLSTIQSSFAVSTISAVKSPRRSLTPSEVPFKSKQIQSILKKVTEMGQTMTCERQDEEQLKFLRYTQEQYAISKQLKKFRLKQKQMRSYMSKKQDHIKGQDMPSVVSFLEEKLKKPLRKIQENKNEIIKLESKKRKIAIKQQLLLERILSQYAVESTTEKTEEFRVKIISLKHRLVKKDEIIAAKDRQIQKLQQKLKEKNCKGSRSMTPIIKRKRDSQFNKYLKAQRNKMYSQTKLPKKENRNPNIKTHRRRVSRSCSKITRLKKSHLKQRKILNNIKEFSTPRPCGFNIIAENVNVFNHNISSIQLIPSTKKQHENLFQNFLVNIQQSTEKREITEKKIIFQSKTPSKHSIQDNANFSPDYQQISPKNSFNKEKLEIRKRNLSKSPSFIRKKLMRVYKTQYLPASIRKSKEKNTYMEWDSFFDQLPQSKQKVIKQNMRLDEF